MSAKKRDSILERVFEAIESVRRNRGGPGFNRRFSTACSSEAIQRNPPPMKKGKRLKLLYATQKRVDRPQVIPVPEVPPLRELLQSSDPYLRAFPRSPDPEAEFPMEGLPFLFTVKSQNQAQGDQMTLNAQAGLARPGTSINRQLRSVDRNTPQLVTGRDEEGVSVLAAEGAVGDHVFRHRDHSEQLAFD